MKLVKGINGMGWGRAKHKIEIMGRFLILGLGAKLLVFIILLSFISYKYAIYIYIPLYV